MHEARISIGLSGGVLRQDYIFLRKFIEHQSLLLLQFGLLCVFVPGIQALLLTPFASIPLKICEKNLYELILKTNSLSNPPPPPPKKNFQQPLKYNMCVYLPEPNKQTIFMATIWELKFFLTSPSDNFKSKFHF